MNLVAPESLVFWTTIIFVALLFLLKKVAWKPILGAVKEREDSINEALKSAENARKEMQNLNADNLRILKEARIERDAMLKEAREMKESIITEAKGEAQAQATKVIEQAKSAIESEKHAAIAEIKNQVAELSLKIAEKVMRSELSDKNKQIKLVEDMLQEVKL
ncbi:MAG: F0F1 ATP synthase subunit B [Lutibacter sp.]|jgi:F-type H+-transporting ATPase subunit b|nr:F0F1 ATP synthase subunit B [Lutibacter sp.]